jgi:flagellar hook-associated protein 3 FlgL
MKTTLATQYRSLNSEMNRLTSTLEDLRNQAATGKKLIRPSDDPAAIRPVLSARSQIRATDRFISSLSTAGDRLANQDTYLDQAENLMVRSKEVAINAINGSLSEADMKTLADEVGYIKTEMLSIANAQVGGQYIFGGYKEDTQPFVENGDVVTYAGDSNIKRLEASSGEYVQTNMPGNELFMGEVDSDGDGIMETTGLNLFNMLDGLQVAVESGDSAGLQNLLGELEDGANQIRSKRGLMGNNAARLESSRMHLEGVRVDLEQILSRYEDVDILDVITEITQTETAFEGALKVTSQVSKLSILDYM